MLAERRICGILITLEMLFSYPSPGDLPSHTWYTATVGCLGPPGPFDVSELGQLLVQEPMKSPPPGKTPQVQARKSTVAPPDKGTRYSDRAEPKARGQERRRDPSLG